MARQASSRIPRPRQGEQGFVLLTLLFVAAAVAVQLAIVLPRAAVQAQRIREERLIYRGEQYKRAIELYFRKFQKYPEKIDDLEDTNGQRFLRRRYKDPLTGEDEWRVIHMGADGRFSDSLIYDTEEGEEQLGRAGVGAGFGIGSDMGQASGLASTGSAYQPGGYPQPQGYPQAPYAPNQPYGQPQGFVSPDGRFRGADRARAVRPSAAPEYPTQGGVAIPGQPGEPQAQFDPNDPNAPPGGQPGDANQQPDYSRMLPSQVPPGAGQQPMPGQPGAVPYGSNRIGGAPRQPQGRVGFGQGGFNQQGLGNQRQPAGNQGQPLGFGVPGASNQAAEVIGRLLTQPRPGGLQGLQGGQAQRAGQAAFKGGIAGVASKTEERGIKVYKGRENYNEWEFVFDYREAQSLGGALASGAPGAALPAGQPGLTSDTTLGGAPGAVGGYPAGVAGGGGAYPAAYPTTGQPGPGTPFGQRGSPSQRGRRGVPSPYDPRSGSPGFNPNLPGTTPNLPGLNQPQDVTTPGEPGAPGQPTPNQPGATNPFTTAPGANQPPGPRGLPPGLLPGYPGYPNQQQGQRRGSAGRR